LLLPQCDIHFFNNDHHAGHGGKSKLHIVDYGMRYGFQWVGLLCLLASKEGGPPEMKFTAITGPKPAEYPSEQIEKIGCRLMKCAN
jgi:hypothetical protein